METGNRISVTRKDGTTKPQLMDQVKQELRSRHCSRTIKDLCNAVHARKPKRLPVVMARGERPLDGQ